MGKVLKIDLTNKTFGEFPWTDEDRERTIAYPRFSLSLSYAFPP